MNHSKPETFHQLDISIVIGSNNEFIMPCLHSIVKGTQSPYTIYVVDNCMSKSVNAQIEEAFPQVKIIKNSSSKSFAQNHNMVMKQSHGEFITLLNDDTLILDGALDKLLAFLQNTPKAGCAGPRLLNSDGTLQPSTYGFPSLIKLFLNHSGLRSLVPPEGPLRQLIQRTIRPVFPRAFARYWNHESPIEAEVLMGACLMVRRAAIQEVGMIDEVSLAFGEEDEWLYRFRKYNWSNYFRPEAEIIHYGQASTGKMTSRLMVEHLKAMLNFYDKHGSVIQFMTLKWMLYLITIVKLTIESIRITLGWQGNHQYKQAYKESLTLLLSYPQEHR